jgi:outer membrane protein OmpA-like peptidoglycan-associated protein
MKKITLFALMVTLSAGAFAQGGEKGPFLTNRFGDNWFISAGGGVNVYMGESDNRVKFGNRLAPAVDVALGKWFTPAVGARLEYSGIKAKGGNPTADAPFVVGDAVKGRAGDTYYPMKFNYSFVHADFLWNISSALGGYKETRFWEFIPFAGFGPAFATTVKGEKETIREFGFTAGLINKLHISKRVDLNLEARGMLVKQLFDGVSLGRKGEGMASVTAGLSIKLGKTNFDKYVPVEIIDVTPLNSRIDALVSDLAAANSRADQLAADLASARGKVTVEKEYLFPDVAIFFEIGKATLSKKEKVNVDFIADAIKKMPAGKKVTLDGNADSVTGTPKGNMTLSEKRIKTVYDELIGRGVKPEQIAFRANGDTEEPFGHDNPTLNRVLVIEQ